MLIIWRHDGPSALPPGTDRYLRVSLAAANPPSDAE
jgi:hypothetical protein